MRCIDKTELSLLSLSSSVPSFLAKEYKSENKRKRSRKIFLISVFKKILLSLYSEIKWPNVTEPGNAGRDRLGRCFASKKKYFMQISDQLFFHNVSFFDAYNRHYSSIRLVSLNSLNHLHRKGRQQFVVDNKGPFYWHHSSRFWCFLDS